MKSPSPTLRPTRVAEPSPRSKRSRRDSQYLGSAARVLRLFTVHTGDAQVHLRAAIVGVDAERALELANRSVVVSRAQEQHAQHDARRSVARVVLERQTEVILGKLWVSAVAIETREARAKIGELGTQRDGALELVNGLRRHAGVEIGLRDLGVHVRDLALREGIRQGHARLAAVTNL